MLSLKEKQELVHKLFDHRERREIRLALSGRYEALVKLEKKENELGVSTVETCESQRIIAGTETEPGLLRIVTLHPPEQQDAFYDQDPGTCRHEHVQPEGDQSVCTDCGQFIHQVEAESSAEDDGEAAPPVDFEFVDEDEPEPAPAA